MLLKFAQHWSEGALKTAITLPVAFFWLLKPTKGENSSEMPPAVAEKGKQIFLFEEIGLGGKHISEYICIVVFVTCPTDGCISVTNVLLYKNQIKYLAFRKVF